MPTGIAVWGAVCLLVVVRCAARQQHPLRALLGGAVCGTASLSVLSVLAPLTGVSLPFNAFTAGTAAVLGLPGVILLVLLDLLL